MTDAEREIARALVELDSKVNSIADAVIALGDAMDALADILETVVPRPLTTPPNHPRENVHGSR